MTGPQISDMHVRASSSDAERLSQAVLCQGMAEPGDRCTCGRPAMLVFDTVAGSRGWCGISDGGDRSGPCPFCGAAERHRTPWGDPAVCPEYRLRAGAR